MSVALGDKGAGSPSGFHFQPAEGLPLVTRKLQNDIVRLGVEAFAQAGLYL